MLHGEASHPLSREGLLLLTVLTQLTRLTAEVRAPVTESRGGLRSQTVEITSQVCSLRITCSTPSALRGAECVACTKHVARSLAVRFAGLMQLPAYDNRSGPRQPHRPRTSPIAGSALMCSQHTKVYHHTGEHSDPVHGLHGAWSWSHRTPCCRAQLAVTAEYTHYTAVVV